MKAIKANKEYRITEANKQAYLNDGYDIIDDEGKIIEYSPKKTIKYSEYQKVVKELEELKANTSNSELTKQVEDLTKANGELTKQVKDLTKQLEKVTNKE